MIGKTLDSRYEIIQHLSRGAFGQTFIAKDTKRPNSPLCVVKQLKPKHSHPEFLAKATELFDREASALELLGEHPQIPRLLAHLQIERDFYLVEEYIQGKTLAVELTEGKYSQQQTIDLLLELLNIVAFVHQHNIIHRDIKPSNIIRRQSDRALVLIDFGAVTKFDGETMMGTIIGTPGYGAPEQYSGKSGFCSDIYAVGAIAIEALTGINPHLLAKNDLDEIIWQDKAQVSPQLAAILTKAVGRNKGNRYSQAEEFIRDLEQLKSPKTNKKLVIPGLVVLLAVPLTLWFTTMGNKPTGVNLPLNGKLVNGNLDSDRICSDLIAESEPNLACEKYKFAGKKGQRITLEMNSDSFDPFLILRQSDGDTVEINGDRSIDNWNARIEATLPSNDVYTVITQTTTPGESGAYTLRAISDN